MGVLKMMDDKNVLDSELFLIEEIDAEENTLILHNLFLSKKFNVVVTDEEIEKYAEAFDAALDNNWYLFVEYDEERGVIIGR